MLSSRFCIHNDPPTTEIYTLSLHDPLPISFLTRGVTDDDEHAVASVRDDANLIIVYLAEFRELIFEVLLMPDRKSTRLNSSHPSISYAVFCLKKKIIDAGRLVIIVVIRVCF